MSLTEIERSDTGRVGPADDRPLTQAEQQIVQRFLSDPFSFPIQFKTWLVSFLESSDVELPIGAVAGLKQILGVAGVGGGILGVLPAGLILPYGGSTSPTGALLCDGASYLRTSFSRLFSAIGTTYGAADANSFNVPDLRGRTAVGRGIHGDVDNLGDSEGGSAANRTPRHRHLIYQQANPILLTAGGDGYYMFPTDDPQPSAETTPSGSPMVDTPAYLTINYIIVA